ncbi:MAG: hypothetical protein ACRDN6_11425 [Gaiellaceae bacterium]
MAIRLHPLAVYGLVKELRIAAADQGPIVVAGARGLADVLRKDLGRGGSPGAVRESGLDGASAVAYVLAAPPSEEDERVLKQAHRARVPVVCVLAGPELEARVPYVLATDVVRVPAGSGFPVEEIARVLAHRLGEGGSSLAARLPVLRPAVCDELIERSSRRAGITGAAIFIPGADLPVLTLLQLRLVLRIGAAHGVEIDQERLPEILAVIGSGLLLRAVARQALTAVPVAGWLVKGAIAYAGTRALGEAAVRYFEARASTSG